MTTTTTLNIEKKLESYQLIAKIFTEMGDTTTAKAACELGLSLNPLCGILKFFQGLVFYKRGIHDKSTKYFNDIICNNDMVGNEKLKLLFEKNNIPFDEMFMESLKEIYSKVRMEKIFKFSVLSIGMIIIGILSIKLLG